MIETPRGGKWDVSLSALASPMIDGSTIFLDSTSSMDYINSQLVAHGFISPPGIILGDTAKFDGERIVKCLIGMLSQRVEDMSRTEELTTKLRTLTYDHERLRSLHRDATETAANAEREMNVHKSRLNAATRALQASETAHKQTTAELQRTRTILQSVRATHQSELKKKEKDIERMAEKWSKIADAQVKLMTVPSGLRCANFAVMTGSEKTGNRSSFLDIALEEAEKARSQLAEDNFMMRKLVVTAVNEMQSALHQVRRSALENREEPILFTPTSLFPLHLPGNASDKLSIVLNNLKDTLKTLSQHPDIAVIPPPPTTLMSDGEVQRLRNVIYTLQEDLERSRKQVATQAAETRAMFDKFAQDQRVATGEIGEMSVELMSAPLRDAERDRLDEIKRQLDQERQKFTEAAIELGKERAEIQAERIKLLDEKRAWHVEIMLADLPPTPQPALLLHDITDIRQSPKKLPRKSPSKVRVGKAGTSTGRKTTRISRRSSLLSPSKVTPPYDTEVLPPLPALTFNPKPLPLAASLLPTSFVLPPPSPHTSLPKQPAILASIPLSEQESPLPSTTPLCPSPPESEKVLVDPTTPPAARRLFPVAKPFAQRMIHAYSPAKPSPLSRILMLGNSPNSPEAVSSGSGDVSSLLEPVVEEDEHIPGFEEPSTTPSAQMPLAAELGVSDSLGESPLQEKKFEQNVVERPLAASAAKGRTVYPDLKRFTAGEKCKAKAPRVTNTTAGRVKTSAAIEKENNSAKTDGKVPARISPPGAVKPVSKPSGVSTSRSRVMAKVPPPAKGGPRRVLVDSDEAPPIGKGKRSQQRS